MVSKYESIIVFKPELPQETIDTVVAKFEKMVTDGQGEVIKTERWGIKKTAYSLGKYKEGFFAYVNYQAPAPVVKNIQGILQVTDSVLRSITTRVQKPRRVKLKKAKKSVVAPSPSPATPASPAKTEE